MNSKLRYAFVIGIAGMALLAGCSGSKSTTVVQGSSPVIESLSVEGLPAATGGTITLTVVAKSSQSLALTYTWTVSSGWSLSSGAGTPTVTITAPGMYDASGTVTVEVSDPYGRYALVPLPVSTVGNSSPVINSFSASPNPAARGGNMAVTVSAIDPDGDALSYTWQASGGWIIASGQGTSGISITAPDQYGVSGTVTVTADDGNGGTVSLPIPVSTVENSAPVISDISAAPNPVTWGGTMALSVTATDPDGDALSYTWTTSAGWTIASGQGTSGITVTAPDQYGAGGKVTVTVSDGYGGSVDGTLAVYTYSIAPAITGLTVSPSVLNIIMPAYANPYALNITATAAVTATDIEGTNLSYMWSITSTTAGWDITGYGATATVVAPMVSYSSATVMALADNGKGGIGYSTTGVSSGLLYDYPCLVGPSGPVGIAIDASGNVWVSNGYSGGYTISEVTSAGSGVTSSCAFVQTVRVGNNPHGIAIDSTGNIWVANTGSDTISEVTSSGGKVRTVQVGAVPYAIAIDSTGNVWVTNMGGNTISEVSVASGYTTGKTISVGSTPYGIAIDASGNAWVANYGSGGSGNTISEVTSAGAFVRTVKVGTGPNGIAIDPSGNVWVSNYMADTISEVTSSGAFVTTVSTINAYPMGIAIDISGNVWVSFYSGSIIEISPAGTILHMINNWGNFGIGIAVDASGNVWGTYNNGVPPAPGIIKFIGAAKGPQYWPYGGPQFPGGGNL